MIACALRHLVLETFGENISLSSLLISVWLKNEWFSNSDKSLDVILKQPILVREHIPLTLIIAFAHYFETMFNILIARLVLHCRS